MYWLREDNFLFFLPWLLVTVGWILGGWLIARQAFKLERRERLLVGFGIGMSAYLWLVNLVGRWLPANVSFIIPALIVLGTGLIFAWKAGKPWLDKEELKVWGLILAGLLLMLFFVRLGKGLAIFDDRKNLSIISTMAAGDIPPHHYMNSMFYFAYHYGFQILGASLMRLGGLMPWSAFDLSKALIGAYSFLLVVLLARRYSDHPWAGVTLAVIFAFASGTRYLMLLLSPGLMTQIDPLIDVRSPDLVAHMPLSQALQQGLVIGDGPPAPFIYAFMNGIGWPEVMAVHAGPSTLSVAIMLLFWLLSSRVRYPASYAILVMLASLWAIVWESSYILFLAAVMLVALFHLRKPSEIKGRPILWLLLSLALSLLIAFFQGGTITELINNLISGSNIALSTGAESGFSMGGFTLRIPPAVYSGHLGALSIFSPKELLVAILELGPIILLTPWITYWSWKRFRQGDWVLGIIVTSAWLSFIFPIFLSFEFDRDIVRFTKNGLVIWTLILGIMLFDPLFRKQKTISIISGFSIVLMVMGGIVIFGTELSAASQAVFTEKGIERLDALIVQRAWDKLEEGEEIFDPFTWRATMLTGRLTRVVAGNKSYDYAPTPEWNLLEQNPSVSKFLSQQYRYVYIDEIWWAGLSDKVRQDLSQPCVITVVEFTQENNTKFRRLIDLAPCQP